MKTFFSILDSFENCDKFKKNNYSICIYYTRAYDFISESIESNTYLVIDA